MPSPTRPAAAGAAAARPVVEPLNDAAAAFVAAGGQVAGAGRLIASVEPLEARTMMAGQPAAAGSSMAYDAAGTLHVAYYDAAAKNLKYTKQAAGGAWADAVVVDATSADVGVTPSLAVDRNGRPGVAYFDATNEDLRFAYFDGTSWKSYKVDSKESVGQNPSLAFDDKGLAVISYYRKTSGDLRLATLKNLKKNQWSISTVAKKGDVGAFSQVSINPVTHKPTVVFADADGKVSIVGKPGAKPVVIDDLAGAVTNVDLGFGPNGAPVVSYFDPATGAIKVASPTDLKAKSFTADTVATVPAGSNPTPTLIVDPATGDPQVVFYSAADDGVFVARKDADNTSGTTKTQLKSGGGEGFTATIQPGNNSISFGVIDTSGGGGGGGSSGPVELNNTETTPLPPTDVGATAAGPNAVSIGWTDQSNNETGFRVERSVDGATFETVGLVAPDVTSFLDEGCEEGTTYYYRVSALGGSGEASIGLVAGAQNANALNRVVTVQTPAKAPTALTAAAASSARIDLAWTDHSNAETGFKVYRKAGGGAFALVATLAANSTSFADTTVAEGTSYTYRVVAARGASESAASNDATAVSLPATPTGVTVARVSTTALAVAWTNNSSAAAQFVLQRSTNGTTFTTVATLPNFTTTYTDTGLAEGSAYYYRVKAVGPVDSEYSAVANGTTDPNAPTNLAATPASTTRIDLSWTDASANETGFVVQRSVDGGESYVTIGTVGAGVTTFADTAAGQGTTYKYRVRATIAGAADSAYSGVVTTAVVPGAPSGLTASLSGGGYTVALAWADTATGETAFQVQRQQQGSDAWVSLPDAAANATSYTDATAAEGTTYSYRVRAVNAYASSAYADAATATTVPNAPTGLVVTTAGTTAINVSWTDNSAGETGFVVERSANGGDTWQTAGTPAAGVATLADTGLTAATTYTYRVRAVNAGGASANTTAVAGTTLTLAPTGLTVSGTTAGTVGLSWTPVTGAASYKVQRSTDGTNFSDHGTTASATFTDSLSVAEATAYTYRVVAVNAGGDSAASSTAAATTRPAAPSGLTATAASATSVTLAWADNSAGETGYEVERAPAGTESFTKIADRPAGATGYTDATAVEGTAYAYRVRATGTGGASTYTTAATATTVPAAPTGVAAAADSASAITVTWTDASANETGYRLERSADGVSGWTQVGSTLAAGTQSAQDTGLSASTTYYYRVVAVGAGGDSAAAAASATTRTVAATGTSASVVSTSAVRLDWNTVAGAEGYVVQEQVSGEWVEVDVAATNTYTVTGLDEATDHTFRVLAHNAGGLSAPGLAVDATTMPAAPAATLATATSATSVTLAWSDVSTGAQGYFVEISTDSGGSFHDAGQVEPGDGQLVVTVEEGTSPQFRVRALRNGVFSAFSDVATVDTAPAAPTGVAVASTSASALTVTWADHSAHETGFRIERATTDSDEDYVQVGTADADETSYIDETVVEGTRYYYRVRATMGSTRNSDYAEAASGYARPAAPTGLSATQGASGVDLAWTNPSVNADTFEVQRSATGADGSYATLDTTADTTFTDATAAAGQTYYYRVIATNEGGDSQPGTAVQATLIPAVPQGVTATVQTGGTSVRVAWTAVAGATGYKVYRTTDGGDTFASPVSVAASDTSYLDTGLTEDTEYGYVVVAANAAGDSAPSGPASTNTTLVPPTNVAASASFTSVTVTWDDQSSGEAGYRIERKTGAGSWAQIDVAPANSQTYTDATAEQGTAYLYRVTAVVNATESAAVPSEGVAATTGLVAPTGLTATPASSTSVTLSWTDNAANHTAVRILRSTDGVGYTQVDSVSPGTTTWTDTGRSPETTYYYKVQAANTVAASAATSAASALTTPAAPSAVTAVAATDTVVTVAWTSASTTKTGFKVERSADAGGSWTTVATPASTETSFEDTGLDEATAYTYRVSVQNASGYGPTTSANVTTKLATPTGPTATAAGATSVSLAWTNASSVATGVRVERRAPAGVWGTLVNLSGAAGYTDATVAEGTSYEYRVVATASGLPASLPTAAATVSTPAKAVTGLAATVLGTTSVKLDWTDVSAVETGFRVERRLGGSNGAYGAVTTLSANAATYTDTGLSEGTSYEYRVVSLKSGLELASGSVTAQTVPAAPTGLTASSPAAGTIRLSWTDNSAHETGFLIQRSADGTTFTDLATPSADATQYDDTVAAGSSYTYRVFAVQNGNSAAAGPVVGLSRPAAPANLAATATSDSAVTVNWESVAGAETYVLERSTDGTSYSPIATLDPDDGPATTFGDTGRAESTLYYYRVKAVNASGAGDYGTPDAALTPPRAATGLDAAGASPTRVDLTWTANSLSATGYTVYRSTAGGAFVAIDDSLPGNAASFSDLTVVGGTAYAYKVVATDGALDSAASNTDAVTTVPAAVASLNAVSSTPTSVAVTWNSSTGASTYLVERSVDGTNWDEVDTVSTNSLADAGVTEGTAYTYRVTPTGAGGDGPAATTAVTTLAAPATSVAVSAHTDTSVTLTWEDNSGGETGFVVERSTDGEEFDELTTTAADAETYTDSTAAEGTQYVYRVSPTNAGGTTPGGTVTVTTRPTAASNVVATGMSATSVQVTWDDNSHVETGYDVYRRLAGTWTKVANGLPAGTDIYLDDDAAAGTAYDYKVVATGTGGDAADSNVASVTTVPAAVADLSATMVSTTRVDLAWTDVAGNTGYRVERKAGSGSFVALPDAIGADDEAFSDTTATEGTLYTYRIVAVNAGGDSAASNEPTVTTPPAAPTGLVAAPTAATTVHLTWTDNSAGETSVTVQRLTDDGWVTAASLDPDANATDVTVDAGSTNSFRVFMTNAGGDSGFTATEVATTVPGQVTGFTATVSSDAAVALAWSAVPGATGYRAYVSDDNGSTFSQVGTDLDDETLTVNATGLTAATAYQFKVVAFNGTGAGADSTALSRVTLPAAPTGFQVDFVSTSGVSVSWNDVTGETGYTLYRQTGAGAFESIADLPAGTDFYLDQDTDPATSYTYKVVATNGTGASADSGTDTALTLTAAPAAPTLTAVTDGSVQIAWSAVTGATGGYNLYRDAGSGFSLVGPIAAGTLTYTDTDVAEAHDYSYKLSAVNGTGESDQSEVLTTNTAPAAPTGAASMSVTTTGVTVTWTDASAGEGGFVVEQSTDGGTEWTSAGTPAALSNTGSGGSFAVSGLTEATDYQFRVVAVLNGVRSAPSNTVSVTTLPDAPTGLTVTASTDSSVSLSWTGHSAGATNFVVQRSTDGTNFSDFDTPGAGTTTSADTGLTEDTQYYYRVAAYRGSAVSAFATAAPVTTALAAPTGLSATVNGPTSVTIDWTDHSAAETAYVIERSVDGGSWQHLDTIAADLQTYTDSAAPESAAVAYRVRAESIANASEWATATGVGTPLSAPTGLTLTPAADAIGLAWTDTSGVETGYRVQRSADGSAWSDLTDLPTGTQQFSDTGLAEDATYHYRVVALDGTDPTSAPSNAPSAKTLLAAPTALAVSGKTATSVTFGWTNHSAAATNVVLEEYDAGNDEWDVMATLDASDVTYTLTGLDEGTAYQFRISATKTGNASATVGVSATTLPAAPTGLTVDASAGSQVDLAWTDAAGSETAYKVERSVNGGAYEVIDTLSTGASNYSDTDVAEAHTYAYRVYAVGAGGNSVAATGAAVTAPADPSGFTATPMSPTQVNLTWVDNSAGETSYVVERSPDGTTWGNAVTLDAGTDEYLVTGLTEGTTYHFRVRAVRTDADAGTAESAWVATSTSTPAAAPTAFAVSVPTGSPQVDLTWADNSAAETGYRIERMTNEDGIWDLVTTTAADATGYSDTGLDEGTRYDYRVMATSAAGNSTWTPELAVRTRPLAPTSLVATAASDTAVGLAWSDNSSVETGYRVQRSLDGSDWADVTDLPTGTQQFSDTGLAEDTTYHYRVVALDGDADPSDPSNAPSVLTPLAAPTSVAVTGKTATTVTLGWTNHSAAATNVVVERYDADNDEWDALATLAGSATTYTTTGLTEGTAYQFRVSATKSGNASATAGATATTLPATPIGLSVAAFSTTEVDLTWTDAATGETGYKVERSVNGGAYELVDTLAADAAGYQDTAAQEGHTYAYLVYAFGGGGDSATAGGSAVTAPADPSSLTATPVSPTRVDLAWGDNSGGETAYVVERSLDGSNWTTLPALDPNSTTYSDTTRTEGTAYHYRVRAERSAAASGWVSTTVSTPAAAPTSVATTVPTGSPRVVVSWADNSAAESGYQVDRSTDGTNWTTVTTTAANATSYSDGTVTEGMTYQYRVRANSAAGNSTWSSPASASTRPSAPAGLAGSAASGTSVSLTWTNVSANAAGYKVEQSISGVWTVIATLSANAASHTVTGLTEGTSYQFRVRAYTAGASGDPTTSVTVATPLSPPSGLSVTPASTSRIDLAWTDNSAVESNYKVERSTDNTVWTTVATLVANTAGYSDTTVAAGTTYYYRVKATKSGLSSTYATASAVTTAPTAPTNAAATANSDTQVTLTWTDAAGETGYTVERSGDGGSTWSVLSSGVTANATTYTDSTTTEETAYLYRVKATNSAGSSAYATAASVTTLPAAPTTLTATVLSSDTAELHWTNVSAAASGVKIERRVSGGSWAQVAQVAGNVSSYVDPTLDESVAYEYRVRATSGGRNSAYSNTAAVSSLPIAATSLTVTGTTTTTVTLGWAVTSAAPTAVIERSDDGGDTFTAIGTVAGNVTTFTDDDGSDRLVEGTTYQYRVRMYNDAGGFSDPTDTVVAVTLAAAPTGVQANVSGGNVLVTWADQSNGEEGFRIERRNQGDTAWTFLWDVEPGTGLYEDVGPDAGSYEYRVSAYNAGGTSPSQVVSAVVPV